jgi:hypothetical protein
VPVFGVICFLFIKEVKAIAVIASHPSAINFTDVIFIGLVVNLLFSRRLDLILTTKLKYFQIGIATYIAKGSTAIILPFSEYS